MPNIAELNLSSWRSLKRVALSASDAPSLTSLNVSGCEQLSLLHLAVPSLTSLQASQCAALTEVDLTGCAKLTRVKLDLCKRLDVLTAPESLELSHLSLFGCRHLGGACVETLLKRSGGSLRELNLNGCVATELVTEQSLRTACPNLEKLDATGRARKF